MNRYPTPLSFDRSGSACIRFFGSKLADVKVHYRDTPTTAPAQLLACPKSIGIRRVECSWCSTGTRGNTFERQVAMGWDVDQDKWCVIVAPATLFSKILQDVVSSGVPLESFHLGYGPDVLIQRRPSMATMSMLLPETTGVPRGPSKRPGLEDFLEGMECRSQWACSMALPAK